MLNDPNSSNTDLFLDFNLFKIRFHLVVITTVNLMTVKYKAAMFEAVVSLIFTHHFLASI